MPSDGLLYIAYVNGTGGLAGGGPGYYPMLPNGSSGGHLSAAPYRSTHLTGSATSLTNLTLSSFTAQWYTYCPWAID